MINAIKNKYETYTPGEFLPIYYEGTLANKKEFHLYKLGKALAAADNACMVFVNRAHGKSRPLLLCTFYILYRIVPLELIYILYRYTR